MSDDLRAAVERLGRGKAWGDPSVPVNVIEVSPDTWQAILDLVEFGERQDSIVQQLRELELPSHDVCITCAEIDDDGYTYADARARILKLAGETDE